MEILSPASNLEHIKVAIDNKANAIYGGLKKWNARNKAINFSDKEYNCLIDELHKNGIKFFLTLNILMLDEEIDEVISFLKNNSLPDSFIVTDVGLIKRLHKEFPNVPLHFSTQFGCHNVDDVNYVKSLGGTRAIMARELTLVQIEYIRSIVDIELECFVWGSQCLSFSGLCFFGSLINGGAGNRGKCIITCRDVYNVNGNDGHFLYTPDMDCTNLISKLENIDCLKLEGRRRDPKEIGLVLDKINKKIKSDLDVGYMLGNKISKNNMFERINTRIKPVMPAGKILNISDDDVCLEYKNNIPVNFSKDYSNPNVMYVHTEIKKDYDVNKKNLSLDFKLDRNKIKEILYVNHKGDGHTFFSSDEEFMDFNFNNFILDIENINKNINIYSVKYKKNLSTNYLIGKKMYLEVLNYIINDCKEEAIEIKKQEVKIKQIYLETRDINVLDHYIDNPFVKLIYDIGTVFNLKQIRKITLKYDDKIIYKLPLFNWKSQNILPFLKLLQDKEIMFTRFTQIYLCKDLRFKKKYVDYTVYVWNNETLQYLKNEGIEEFTSSPELDYKTNKKIFDKNDTQVILGGKLPLVYTRNCFEHLFGCSCNKTNKGNVKNIKNKDKNMDFEILCNQDFRYILNKNPILNNYNKVCIESNIKFRYVLADESFELIDKTLEALKGKDYYNDLKKIEYWKKSYECNVSESRC